MNQVELLGVWTACSYPYLLEEVLVQRIGCDYLFN